LNIQAHASEGRKKARGVQPGSFLSLMINSKHESSGRGVSDVEATSQAFTFLLAGYETTVCFSQTFHAIIRRMFIQSLYLHPPSNWPLAEAVQSALLMDLACLVGR